MSWLEWMNIIELKGKGEEGIDGVKVCIHLIHAQITLHHDC